MIIFVTVVSFGTLIGARMSGMNRSAASLTAELDQLEQYREVLQKKALRAQLENWDSEMMDRIAYQLEEVEQRIARLTNQR